MGVSLDLRLIDHRHVVERGTPVIHDAIVRNDASILLEYILSIPFTPDPEQIAYRQERCDRLRALKAPDVIIQFEERMLRLATGAAYSRGELSAKTMDELRQVLGTWCWAQNSFSFDKSWHELDWYRQPAEGSADIALASRF